MQDTAIQGDIIRPAAESLRAAIACDASALFCRAVPVWKRTVDVLGALIGIIIAAPVMIPAALCIKCTSPGPILFRQQRTGLGGRPFTLYKFRSMYPDAEQRKRELMRFNERQGPVFKMTNDPRITPVGKFIRKWSIDELPQLFNVLFGDMSLVGPRPLPVEESNGCDQWHRRRLDVKPGVTCLWQVMSRDASSFDEWARLDIEYITRHSFLLDVRILVMTIPAVFSHRGAK